MDKIIIDAVRYFNRASMSWGFMGMGISGQRMTFDDYCMEMRKKLEGIGAFQDSYRKQIQGSVNLLKDAMRNQGLTRKEDICPFALVFASVLETRDKPKKKYFIDIFRCLFYNEYGVTDPLSLPFEWGFKNNYTDII